MNTETHERNFIVFHRDTLKGEFDHLYGGPWHWGLEDHDGTLRVSYCGLETERNARSMVDMYARAIYQDGGTEWLDRQLTSLPEGTVVDSIIRMTYYCPPPIHDDYRQSSSYRMEKALFVAAALKELGWSK